MSEQRRPERGVALFAAIWLAMIVAALSLGASRESRVFVRVADNETAALDARLLAEAGVTRTALALAAQAAGESVPMTGSERLPGPATTVQGGAARWLDGSQPLRVDGAPYAWAHRGALVRVRAQAEAGKLDLNQGDGALLEALLAEAGVDDPRAARAAIERVRAPAGGVGRLSWRLQARPFNSVAELAAQPGITPRAYRRLAPWLTVWSGLARPDPLTAPEPVFAVLPLTRDARQRLRARRQAPSEPLTLTQPAHFTIIAEAEGPGGASAVAEALVEIAPRGPRRVRFIDRRTR